MADHITASLRMERPVDEVRARYRDAIVDGAYVALTKAKG